MDTVLPDRLTTDALAAGAPSADVASPDEQSHSAGLPELGWDEILRHDRPGDFWVVFHNGVYDVSEWIHHHPGGAEVLIGQYGQDASELFARIGHSMEAMRLALSFRVGVLKPGSVRPQRVGRPEIAAALPFARGEGVHGPGAVQAGPKVNPLGEGGDADPRELPQLGWDEILRHDRPGDYWLVIGGDVYDVGEWIYHHPGGAEVYIDNYGRDAGPAFEKVWHSDEAWNLAQTFKVGRVKEGSTPPARPGRPRMTAASVARPPAGTGSDDGLLEIPWAVRWLVPRGERFANFDILNDTDTQLDYFRRFGHIYAVGVPTKKWRLVVVSDPDLLDEVAGNDEQFGKRVEEINFFEQLAGSRGGGISVVGDGDYYDSVRRVMLPWYAPSHQKTQFDRMKDVARRTMAAWAERDDGAPLELREWMERYALEISGRGACNYDFRLLERGASPAAFASAVPASTKESIARITEPRPDLTLFSPPGKRRRKRAYRRHNDVLFRTAEALVQGRLNTCPAGEQTDLLTRLTTVPDPDTGRLLDPATVRDQILMHLSNGFNGPSITLAWIGYLLATHPDVEDRLVAEVDGITGGDPGYDLKYEDLMRLPYTTQVIKETLRIHPPMPVTIRRSLRDGSLGRYRIRKHDIILVGTLAAQRDERYWGPQADRFDPDQFAMEKVVERPRHAFIPFSVGQRQCMAQEVTFMMLRIALFEIYNRYRLRLPEGVTIVKNTSATTKPVAVPVLRIPREGMEERQEALATRRRAAAASSPGMTGSSGPVSREWDRPSEIPETSAFRHITVAYGSNFGTSKDLAERFVERSRVFGYTNDLLCLNDLVDLPPRTQPWLLVVITATYTANPPSNAIAFKSWLERTEPGCEMWRNCRYLVFGLGNSQWNAFLAFPRYVDAKLRELQAQPLGKFAFGDVSSPVWEESHSAWNDRTWPVLLDLSGARPSEAAAARLAAEKAAEEERAAAEASSHAVASLDGEVVAPRLLTNAVGVTTFEVEALVCRELQAPESESRTRHLEVSLPEGFEYTAGDHLGICPENDPALVARLAEHLGVPLDGIFSVPRSMPVRAVPKGVVLSVRNVLTSLIDITSLPQVPLLDLLLSKALEPAERDRLESIRQALVSPHGHDAVLGAAVRGGGYNVVHLLDEFGSCSITLFEFLQVAQPLRPRYYSTSSSPRIHGTGVAHVSVGRHLAPVPGMEGRHFCGMSSGYVHRLREGDRLNIFLDRAEGFHLQEDVSKPMIFVSAGTGYAPMRAFLWERLAMRREGQRLAPAALFNGIRSSRLDYIYRDEIEIFVAEGVLDHLHVAMSREVPGRRDYVQGRIVGEAPLVWSMLEAGAFVYVCGSEAMRDEVRAAFVAVASSQGGLGPEDAEAFVVRLEAEKRYRPDVWG